MAKMPNLAMKKKMMIILIAFVAVGFSVLIGRLLYLQVIRGELFEGQAVQQQLREVTISPKRGTIYDRNMKALAQSATVWSVYVAPSYIKNDQMRSDIADQLSKMLGIDRASLYQQISKKTSYEVVKRKIEKPEADLVRQYITQNSLSCVGLVEDSKRYYPYGNLASQVLGFTGADNQGLGGLEAEYDSVLKGTPGKMVSAKNAKGTDMSFKFDDYIAPKSGNSLVLTIDEVVQQYLEKSLSDAVVTNKVANKATGIIMNVKTGEILAMATVPGYDPNNPFALSAADQQKLTGLSGDALTKEKNTLLQNMWRNKAISDPYEPGSTFKVVTTSAALNEKVVNLDTQFFDPGSLTVAGRKISCWKAGGHGQETFLQGVENSCNVVFMKVAALLGANKFFKYFKAFGLTQQTGVDLPGEAKASQSLYHSESGLGPVQLAVSSFGQTFKITPIQLITAVSAAANGGKLVQPHLVKEEIDSSGNIVKKFGEQVKGQVISTETSKEVCSVLEKVVSEGTGKNAYVAGYRVAGKTGTSQKIDVDAGKSLRIASFVGFAPADDPQYAVLVLLDEPHGTSSYGGVIAAPVEGAIFSDILPYLKVEPKYTAEELKKLDISTPDVTGKSVVDAQKALAAVGLNSRSTGSGQTVLSQVPVAGQPISQGGTVILNTGPESASQTVTVPDVLNLSANQVNQKLAQAGLNFRLIGAKEDAGVVSYQQDVAAGASVPAGTVVTVSFRDNNIDDS